MISIDDKLISDDLTEEHFCCDLDACKGACCVEGENGAPLEAEEINTLEDNFPKIKPYLSKEGVEVIEENGVFYLGNKQEYYAATIDDKLCAFGNIDEKGLAYCGIEKAFNEGKIDFKKPVSCHLYPVRIEQKKDYIAVNYDQWDICKAACSFGKKNKLPLYQFLKEALIRKFGKDFYEALDTTAKFMNKK